jgi:hypothetical protein
VENVVGGLGNDTLIGNARDNVLTGRAGDDTIIGRGGRDQAVGDDGTDSCDAERKITGERPVPSFLMRSNDGLKLRSRAIGY